MRKVEFFRKYGIYFVLIEPLLDFDVEIIMSQ